MLPVHENADENNLVEYYIAIQKDIIIFPNEKEALKSGNVQKILVGDDVPPIETLAITIGYSV